VPVLIETAKGQWQGKSRLNLPWLAAEKQITESDSFLRIETDSQDKFATLTYDWHYEGKREEGMIILAKSADSEGVQFGWVDSWHQSEAVLHLKGEESGK
jgi:hypothetical protein